MEFKIEDALKIFNSGKTVTEATRIHCKEIGLLYDDRLRMKLSRRVRKEKDLENFTETDTNQYEKVSTLSALKVDGTIMSIDEYCDFYNIPKQDVRTYKLVTHTGKGAYYNIASNVIEDVNKREDFFKKLVEELASTITLPKSIKRELDRGLEESYLLVVDPADLHIGKLSESFETGEEYNNQIAVQRAKEGVEGIIQKAKGYKIDKILFVGGNDILHIDTPKRTTTSGTPQDTDGMWYSNFLIAKQLYVELLNRLLQVADVHFVYNPSNHDYVNGFFLADVIQTYFKDVKNITFDCSIAHRKYFVYGDNLIGTTHGDGGKTEQLPLTMAHEAKEQWGTTKHKYIYTHHVHHKVAKDYMGVTVESLRSASSADSWHHRNQYHFAPKAVEGFIHSKIHGQVARFTHLF